jgi:ribosomal protein S27E
MGSKHWTIETIRERSKELHNNKFIIYSIKSTGKFKNKVRKIDIECNDCGYRRWSTISNHISHKIGCASCSGMIPWTLKKVQEESNKIHNNKFNIKSIFIKDGSTNISIECIDCNHNFNTTAFRHIKLQSGCTGKCRMIYDRESQILNLKSNLILANQSCNLYFLKFTHKTTNEQFYKVGKTFKNINHRFRGKQYSTYIIDIISVIKATHLWVAIEENKFITNFKQYRYIPKNKFGGYTECFSKDIYNIMFNNI